MMPQNVLDATRNIMQALTISDYGSAEQLQLSEVNKPLLRTNDVLLEVKAASINPVDYKIRRGDLSLILPRKFPRTLGMDVAGVVAEIGASVRKFKVGDRVFGITDPFRNQSGSYAEYALVQDTKLALMQESLMFENAASLPVAGHTAYKALFELGAIRPGHHILINGAAGGVGSFAVQLAKIAGARVTATCGANNIDFVRSLGADEVFDYKVSDIRKLEEKFNIFFDASAKLDFFSIKHLLTEKGVYITTAPKADFLLAGVLTAPFGGKKALVVIAGLGSKVSQELAELANLVCSEKLKPVISKIVSLQEVAAAHREAELEHTRGKIIVSVG
jgi:NADPH:quinone reductase-like Zn-dependent oxidoreductase